MHYGGYIAERTGLMVRAGVVYAALPRMPLSPSLATAYELAASGMNTVSLAVPAQCPYTLSCPLCSPWKGLVL